MAFVMLPLSFPLSPCLFFFFFHICCEIPFFEIFSFVFFCVSCVLYLCSDSVFVSGYLCYSGHETKSNQKLVLLLLFVYVVQYIHFVLWLLSLSQIIFYLYIDDVFDFFFPHISFVFFVVYFFFPIFASLWTRDRTKSKVNPGIFPLLLVYIQWILVEDKKP